MKCKFPSLSSTIQSPPWAAIVTSALHIPRESTCVQVCMLTCTFTHNCFSVLVPCSGLDTPKVWTSAHTHTKWLHSFALASWLAPHRDSDLFKPSSDGHTEVSSVVSADWKQPVSFCLHASVLQNKYLGLDFLGHKLHLYTGTCHCIPGRLCQFFLSSAMNAATWCLNTLPHTGN